MPIEIEKLEGGYVARVTPPHGQGREWTSETPQPAEVLIADLQALGCHQTDIGDAFYAADPNWLNKH
jgi:hypothetical protein